MADQRCPLCGSSNVAVDERIATDDIIELYHVTFDIRIADSFRGVEYEDYYSCAECGLHFFSPGTTGGADFYTQLRRFDWYHLPHKYEFTYCSGFIPHGARVLDIGCGGGAFAGSLPGREYVGLEPHPTVSAVPQDAGTLCGMDLETFLATDPEPFDVVCAFQVLEHLRRPGAFIEKALSCLHPDGRLILSTPSLDSFLRCVCNSPLAMPPHHVTHWPDRTFHHMTGFGLELEHLHHEPLQDVTLPWFCAMFRLEQLKKQQGIGGSGLIDLSPDFRRLEREASRMAADLLPVFSDPVWRPVGHSVIAIYGKEKAGPPPLPDSCGNP